MATPVGEDNWIAYLDEAVRNASDLEKRVHAVEVHKRAVSFEPGSLRLWLAYCNYFWSLWSDSQCDETRWSEEERLMGRELFSFGSALNLWQQGYEAIKYRISDSHQLWDRWVSLELQLLSKTRTPDGIKRITHLYRDRLVTPHVTWDETSQAFSSFLSEYSKTIWEDTMKEVTAGAQEAKRLVAARDPFELTLKQAARSGDTEAEKTLMMEYLEWEMRQSKRNNDTPEIGLDICRGLYERAVTNLFAFDENVWVEYAVYLSSANTDRQSGFSVLDILRRAVQHCPWSGSLWNQYILSAEEARLPFSEVESIKHAATSEDQLYKHGMESMIEMYVAWCGFLKRTAMDAAAGDEAVDVADVGLPAALEDVAVVGKRLYGKDFQGDPKFRLERIYIQYLTEKKAAIEDARAQWNKLASTQIHADSHEFWFRYYMWEMLIFSSRPVFIRSPTPSSGTPGLRVPTLATSVLTRAVARKNIDWPEKVLEVYLQHCNDYEPAASVRRATDRVHKSSKEIKWRREREQQEKEAAYAAYYAQQPDQPPPEAPALGDSKRKRTESQGEVQTAPENSSKRQKNEVEEPQSATDITERQTPQQGEEQPQQQAAAKRDRENATVIVENLPGDVTNGKVRQYFKDYGHINNLTALVRDEKTQSATALIEFKTAEEAQSALLRDGKFFGESQLKVGSGHDLTVYVTNYPPAADDKFIRGLFRDCGEVLSIRWPSLKVNTHRRFCYVSFRRQEAAAAATRMNGTVLEGRYRLVAKYSDPGHRKSREGALAEGREVHITNLDKFASEGDLRDVFAKYGKVTRVNIPVNLGGKNRGFAFIDFETKEEASKAVSELNNTKFRSQIIQVDISKESKFKPAAKTVNVTRDSASPAPSSAKDAEGDETMQDTRSSKPSPAEIEARTISLMGLPDTVNDARVRALVESLGTIVKLHLQPSRGGARIEFADAAVAGQAGLQLDGLDYEGHKLRTGSGDELRSTKAATSQAKKPKDAKHLAPTTALRRPGAQKSGPKRGLGFINAKSSTGGSGGTGAATHQKSAPKSNADFKAMFLAGVNGDEGKTQEGENGI